MRRLALATVFCLVAAAAAAEVPAPGRAISSCYVLLPISPQTRGHGTHSWPAVWQEHLRTFLAQLPD